MINSNCLHISIYKPSQSFKLHYAIWKEAVLSDYDYVFQFSSLMRYSDELLILVFLQGKSLSWGELQWWQRTMFFWCYSNPSNWSFAYHAHA